MSEVERLVGKILQERPDLSETDIRRLIDEKKQRLKGLITDLAAAYMLASEFGVKVGETVPKMRIADVVSGLGDVTLTGRVVFIYPIIEGKPIKVRRILLADNSGKIRATFWGEKIATIDHFREGDIVRITHAYVRPGLDGKPEINVGDRATVQINPSDANDGEYPTVHALLKKLRDVTPNDTNVFTIGMIEDRIPAKVFLRKGREGKVARALLRDETGTIIASFWDEKADELERIDPGKWIEIKNARARRAPDGSAELRAGRSSRVEVLEKPPIELPAYTKISELKVGTRSVNVVARVVAISTERIPSVLIDDGSGTIRLNLWNEAAGIIEKVKIGDVLLIRSANVRSRLSRLSLVLGRFGSISINPSLPPSASPPPVTGRLTKIIDVRNGQRNITVEGRVVESPAVRQVMTMRGEIVDVASFRVRDDTGVVRVSVWRDLVAKVRNLPVGSKLRIQNVFARIGLEGKVELSSTIFTGIKVFLSKHKPEKTYR